MPETNGSAIDGVTVATTRLPILVCLPWALTLQWTIPMRIVASRVCQPGLSVECIQCSHVVVVIGLSLSCCSQRAKCLHVLVHPLAAPSTPFYRSHLTPAFLTHV